MENALSVPPVRNSAILVAQNKNNAFNDKVFRDCRKSVKKSEVRDADWALYAAQSCLSRAFVTAPRPQADLIAQKMLFIQGLLNKNIEQDQDIYSREMKDKSDYLLAKADAKAKTLPVTTDFVKTSTAAAVDVANSSLSVIREIKNPLPTLKQ